MFLLISFPMPKDLRYFKFGETPPTPYQNDVSPRQLITAVFQRIQLLPEYYQDQY